MRTAAAGILVVVVDGSLLARHPHNRGNSGWLIWLREIDEDNMQEEP